MAFKHGRLFEITVATKALSTYCDTADLSLKVETADVTTGTAAWAGGTSLNVALQGAIDSGTPTYAPGAWNTFAETGAILTANLTASLVIARFPWLPPFPANLRPRYLRLLFTPVGTFTAGAIASALVTLVRDDQFNKYAAANYKVA